MKKELSGAVAVGAIAAVIVLAGLAWFFMARRDGGVYTEPAKAGGGGGGPGWMKEKGERGNR